MNILREIFFYLCIFSSVALTYSQTTVFGPEETRIGINEYKSYTITYRIDEGNKRGKPQKQVIVAASSSKAKESFRTSNPNAVIISCTEVKK